MQNTWVQKLTLLLVVVICSSGCREQADLSRLNSIEIEATGSDFNWHFRYPGADGILGTADDEHSTQDLFLPDHAAVKLNLRSEDYIYSFALPDLGLKQIAVPELDFDLQFKTGAERTIPLMGDQFCGYAHKTLIGKVHIRNQGHDFYEWAN